jgi:AraC family transcriptional regulator
METLVHDSLTIGAESLAPMATAHLIHFAAKGPGTEVMHERESYWLDLCLTPRPRNSRACYSRHWQPDRYERLGQVFVLPPGETLQVCGDGGSRQTSLLCQLTDELMHEWTSRKLEWTGHRLEASLDISDSNVRGLLLRLAQELRSPGFASESLVELVTGQLAIELARYWDRMEDPPAKGGFATWRMRLIEERLNDISHPPQLAELARLCNLSVRQLTRSFRASQGCSISTFIANYRLEQAKRLLGTDLSVKAIAYSLGFSSPSSFCCAFRRSTGRTPMQFRTRR